MKEQARIVKEASLRLRPTARVAPSEFESHFRKRAIFVRENCGHPILHSDPPNLTPINQHPKVPRLRPRHRMRLLFCGGRRRIKVRRAQERIVGFWIELHRLGCVFGLNRIDLAELSGESSLKMWIIPSRVEITADPLHARPRRYHRQPLRARPSRRPHPERAG
jgi:hypothetical protein